LSTLGFAQK